MNLEDWRDVNWLTVDLARWTSTAQLDWTAIGAGDWQRLQAKHWGYPAKSNLSPLFPSVSLESLGFSQDDDYIYLPLQSMDSSWTNLWTTLSASQWKTITVPQWTGMTNTNTITAQQLFYVLLLKLKAAALPAHQAKGSPSIFVVESRALVSIDDFDPDDY